MKENAQPGENRIPKRTWEGFRSSIKKHRRWIVCFTPFCFYRKQWQSNIPPTRPLMEPWLAPPLPFSEGGEKIYFFLLGKFPLWQSPSYFMGLILLLLLLICFSGSGHFSYSGPNLCACKVLECKFSSRMESKPICMTCYQWYIPANPDPAVSM